MTTPLDMLPPDALTEAVIDGAAIVGLFDGPARVAVAGSGEVMQTTPTLLVATADLVPLGSLGSEYGTRVTVGATEYYWYDAIRDGVDLTLIQLTEDAP